MISQRLIKLPKVIELTSLSRSTIYDKIGKHQFPSQINLGGKSVAWLENEICEWIDKQIEQTRNSNNCNNIN